MYPRVFELFNPFLLGFKNKQIYLFGQYVNRQFQAFETIWHQWRERENYIFGTVTLVCDVTLQNTYVHVHVHCTWYMIFDTVLFYER